MAGERLAAIGERFLSTRSYTLIVAPAIADLQFDGANGVIVRSYLAALRAMAGAACEDVRRDVRGMLTFAALVLIPTCYYAFLFLMCLPALHGASLVRTMLALSAGSLVLSTLSAVLCYWPERLPDRAPPEAS